MFVFSSLEEETFLERKFRRFSPFHENFQKRLNCESFFFLSNASFFIGASLKRLDNKPYDQPKIKRRTVNRYGEIITDDSYFKEVYDEIEQEEAAKITKKGNSKQKRPRANQSVAKRLKKITRMVLKF